MIKIMHVNLAKGFRGGERQTVLLIKALADFGCQQALVCRIDSPMRELLSDVENVVFVSANNQISGHCSHFDAQVVHAHEAKAVHWAFINFLITKKPYIITRRVDTPIKDKLFNRLTYRYATQRVSISNQIRSLMSSSNFGESELIPSASADFRVDMESLDKIKSKYEDFFLVGQAGALVDKHKGQKVTVDAARILAKKYPKIKFLMLGSGGDEQLLKTYSFGCDNLEWLGFKENVADYISALDLFIFPSRNEGLGSVLLDVMNLNVPIVATKVGGIPDLILDQKTGLLIDSDSPEALANAIETLYLNAELREKLVASAAVFVENYTPASMANRYMKLYQGVLG